ncbi:hypothetical protein C7C56_011700 [Massilia glaciei]|uniref:Argininosuccinate lyase n=2 Tax=Massilia glaciei TaxID=1524097 RepID=A0A2U2HLV8_9BURK|nr:hypothetical protein C7C56_011700 [Massilia glaciei]
MKILSLAVALLGAGLLVGKGAAAGNADFTIVNKTGYPIRHIYIAPGKSKTWGEDRLGDGILENNKKRLIKFSSKAACTQSLNVTFDDDDSEVEWDDFNLCEINTITLKYNRKTREVSADEE